MKNNINKYFYSIFYNVGTFFINIVVIGAITLVCISKLQENNPEFLTMVKQQVFFFSNIAYLLGLILNGALIYVATKYAPDVSENAISTHIVLTALGYFGLNFAYPIILLLVTGVIGLVVVTSYTASNIHNMLTHKLKKTRNKIQQNHD